MMLKALVVEQLEESGILRSLTMKPGEDREELTVAIGDTYDEERNGPFHFQDNRDALRYEEGFARCHARKLGDRCFYRRGSVFHVETGWVGIPTEGSWLSYYALSLPEFGIPQRLSVTDPRSGREYHRTVIRDDRRNRYVVYLECRSHVGRFDFDLLCEFVLNREGFEDSQYIDPDTYTAAGSLGDDWSRQLSEENGKKVTQFVFGNIHVSGSTAVSIGGNAEARNTRVGRNWNDTDLDLDSLARDLSLLTDAVRREPSGPERDIALGAVVAAETAAGSGDGATALEHLRRAGRVAGEVATRIGVNVASEAIKIAAGL